MRMVLALTLAGVLAHAAAMTAIQFRRGDATAYAFQSPDAGEYVALARGLAWHRQYAQYDRENRALTGPDTWRTPGYPLFLAAVIRLVGDGTLQLLLAQQLVAVSSIPLLWLLLRRLAKPRWAILAALAWCFDPFRLYYAQWLLSETLFTTVLIVTCLCWLACRDRMSPQGTVSVSGLSFRWSLARSLISSRWAPLALGIFAGSLVLIRPIALPLPILALLGVILATASGRRHGSPPSAISRSKAALAAAMLCLAGTAIPLVPWLVRIHALTGHVAISQQSGASLAYHKVVDVILWSQGRAPDRFDESVTGEIRREIDDELRHRWLDTVGPLTPAELESLSWKNLNYGKPLAGSVDPFIASRLLWAIGRDRLAERPAALFRCFTAQGVMMLIFPLGLVIWPPTGSGAAPLATLLGEGPAAQVVSVLIGGAYAALIGFALARLTLVVVVRLATRISRLRSAGTAPKNDRSRAGRPGLNGSFAVWPALAMWILSLPFEDPRFRLPLVPLFWILAVSNSYRRGLPSAGSIPKPKGLNPDPSPLPLNPEP